MMHKAGDHHEYREASVHGIAVTEPDLCLCGAPEYTGIHDRPYCGDCDVTEPDPLDFSHGVTRWRRLRFWITGRP